MIEAAGLAFAFEGFFQDRIATNESPAPIEAQGIQKRVVDTTLPDSDPSRFLITATRYTTLVEAVNGDKTVFQLNVFDSRHDTASPATALDTSLIPDVIRNSQEKPLVIAVLMGGSSEANGALRIAPALLRQLYHPDDGASPLDKPVQLVFLSHPHGSPHEGKMVARAQSASLLKRAYEQMAQQANLGMPEYLIGHSAGSLIAQLATPESTLILVDPTGLEDNNALLWKFLAIPWRELVRGKFKDENLLAAIKKSVALGNESLLSPTGEVGSFNPLREYTIGWFRPIEFFRQLGRSWGLTKVRGINPSVRQLSRSDQVFDRLEASGVHLLQMLGSDVVRWRTTTPESVRLSPQDLLHADSEALEKELEKRSSKFLAADYHLVEGHHNSILTEPGPLKLIASIIRGAIAKNSY
jgi:hypothetical protein